MNGVIAVLDWIAASYWHAAIVCFLVIAFRPVRVTINRKDNDE